MLPEGAFLLCRAQRRTLFSGTPASFCKRALGLCQVTVKFLKLGAALYENPPDNDDASKTAWAKTSSTGSRNSRLVCNEFQV